MQSAGDERGERLTFYLKVKFSIALFHSFLFIFLHCPLDRDEISQGACSVCLSNFVVMWSPFTGTNLSCLSEIFTRKFVSTLISVLVGTVCRSGSRQRRVQNLVERHQPLWGPVSKVLCMENLRAKLRMLAPVTQNYGVVVGIRGPEPQGSTRINVRCQSWRRG